MTNRRRFSVPIVKGRGKDVFRGSPGAREFDLKRKNGGVKQEIRPGDQNLYCLEESVG